MTADELAAKAKQNQLDAEAGKRKQQTDIEQFKAGVAALLDDVVAWLDPFVKNGTAKIQRQSYSNHDTTVNARYEIERLDVEIGAIRIQVKPDFLYGVGGCCYVDITGLGDVVGLFKRETGSPTWVSRKSKASFETVAFNREQFMERLAKRI